MKKSSIAFVCIMLAAITVFLTGCEVSVSRKGDKITAQNTLPSGGTANTEAPAYDYTAIVEVTDDEGNVIGTKSVQLSEEDKNANQSFFKVDDENVKDGVNAERVETEQKQDDYEILKSKKYVVTGRLTTKDGVTSEYKAARNGTLYSALSSYNGAQVGIIIDALNIYIVDPNKKTYFSVSKLLIGQYSDEDDDIMKIVNGSAFESSKKVSEETEENVDGVKMRVIKYDDGSADYYNGGCLVKSYTTEGSTLYYDSVSGEVSPGMFVPPLTYTYKPLTAETVSELADSVGVKENG